MFFFLNLYIIVIVCNLILQTEFDRSVACVLTTNGKNVVGCLPSSYNSVSLCWDYLFGQTMEDILSGETTIHTIF